MEDASQECYGAAVIWLRYFRGTSAQSGGPREAAVSAEAFIG